MNLNWFNCNSQRAYPLCDTASRKDDNGRTLPNNILLDLNVSTSVSYAKIGVYSIILSPKIIGISLCDYSQNNAPYGVLTGSWAYSQLTEHSAHSLTALDARYSGWVVFGELSAFMSGHYTFVFSSYDQAKLALSAIKYIGPAPISHIEKLNNPQARADGIIRISCGANVFIVEEPLSDTEKLYFDHKLKIQLTKDGLEQTVSQCLNSNLNHFQGISINDVYADDNGVLKIVFAKLK